MNLRLFDDALRKGAAAERLDREEALALASARTPDLIHRLGEAALANCLKRFDRKVTYVFNLQINPSNLCVGDCGFCDFSAKPGDGKAYSMDEEEIFSKVDAMQPVEVHIVGGLNRKWDYRRNLELVRELRNRHPAIHIKAFTAVEIDWFAHTEKIDPAEVLGSLKEAGLDALPGGGAEIFSSRIRETYCPTKLTPAGWIEIHRAAHRLGITTNATMLAGLGESDAERVDHMLALREAQDDGGAFSCFIPLAFQPGENASPDRFTSPLEMIGIIALSRLTLDNFPHVKAYWPMIGVETASVSLSWGADDLDGTIGEERIAHAAGARAPRALARERMEETIRLGGFTPVERDGEFNPVSVGAGFIPARDSKVP